MTARPVPISDEPHLGQVLGQIHDRLGRIEERTAGIEQRTASIEERTASIEERTASIEQRTAGIEERTASIEQRMVTKDDLEGFATKDDLDVVVREIRVGFSDVNTSMAAIHDKLDSS